MEPPPTASATHLATSGTTYETLRVREGTGYCNSASGFWTHTNGGANLYDRNLNTEAAMAGGECWLYALDGALSGSYVEIAMRTDSYGGDRFDLWTCPDGATSTAGAGCVNRGEIPRTQFSSAVMYQLKLDLGAHKYLIVKRTAAGSGWYIREVEVHDTQHFTVNSRTTQLIDSLLNFTRPLSTFLRNSGDGNIVASESYTPNVLRAGDYLLWIDTKSTDSATCACFGGLGSDVPNAIVDQVVLRSENAGDVSRQRNLVWFRLGVDAKVGFAARANSGHSVQYYEYDTIQKRTKLPEAQFLQYGGLNGAVAIPFSALTPQDDAFTLDGSLCHYCEHGGSSTQNRIAWGGNPTLSLQIAANAYYGNLLYVFLLETGVASTQTLTLEVNGKVAPELDTYVMADAVGHLFLIEKTKDGAPLANGVERSYSLRLSNYANLLNVHFASWRYDNDVAKNGAQSPGKRANVGVFQDDGGILSLYGATELAFLQPSRLTVNTFNKTATDPLVGTTLTIVHNASGQQNVNETDATNFARFYGVKGDYTVIATKAGYRAVRTFRTYESGYDYTLDLFLTPVSEGYLGSQYDTASGSGGGTAAGLELVFTGPVNVTIPARIEINVTRNFNYPLFVGAHRIDPATGAIQSNVVLPAFWSDASANKFSFYYPPRTKSGAQDQGLYVLWVMNETGNVLAYRKFFLSPQGTNFATYDAAITGDIVESIEDSGYRSASQVYETQYQASIIAAQRTIRDQVYEDFEKVHKYAPLAIVFLLVLAVIRAVRR